MPKRFFKQPPRGSRAYWLRRRRRLGDATISGRTALIVIGLGLVLLYGIYHRLGRPLAGSDHYRRANDAEIKRLSDPDALGGIRGR